MVSPASVRYRSALRARADATYLPGRGAKVFYRPKPSVSDADLAEPTPSTAPSAASAAPASSGSESQNDKSKSGPLHTLAENLKSVLPGHHSHHHGEKSVEQSSSVTSAVKDAVRSTASAAGSRDMVIGSLGILHPSVLGHFELARPCSCVEIDVEPLL